MNLPDGTRQSDLNAVDLDSGPAGCCDNCEHPCSDLHGGRDQVINECLVAVPANCCLCIWEAAYPYTGETLDACERCEARLVEDVRRRA